MNSIFPKILLWFVGTLVLSLVAYAATSIALSPRRFKSGPGDFPDIAAMQLDDARRAYETGGVEELSAYLRRLDGYFPGEHYLVDADGRDLVSGEDRSDLLRQADRPPSGLLIVFSRATPDRRYRFVVRMTHPESPNILPYYLWIVVVIVLLCYILAVHLASPLRSLRRTVERFGQGDFSARAALNRKDEFGALSRAFDQMAERIETLLVAERQLLQDVSHELRSPLARLGFAVELARTSDNRETALARIQKEVDRLSVLVGELLQLTRAEGDPSARNLEEVPLHDFLRDLVEDCSLEASVRSCRIDLRVAHPLVLLGERELLHRAIENVVRNAIRHAPPGTAVEVSLDALPDGARIAVRDYGPGVPEPLLDDIFRPFVRVETDRGRSSGGVGLGLAIVRRAVQLHRGRVEARNANPGLCVTIELPIGEADKA